MNRCPSKLYGNRCIGVLFIPRPLMAIQNSKFKNQIIKAVIRIILPDGRRIPFVRTPPSLQMAFWSFPCLYMVSL